MTPDGERPPATFASAMRAVLTLPVLVGVVVPLLVAWIDPASGFMPWGLLLVLGGVAIVIATVRDFYVVGKGTLAPWDPPRQLVTTGLFAHCRNPMYVGVLLVLAGWSLTFWSWRVAGYAALVALAFHARVLFHEERWAARTFPDTWPAYRDRVPRWIPRIWHNARHG